MKHEKAQIVKIIIKFHFYVVSQNCNNKTNKKKIYDEKYGKKIPIPGIEPGPPGWEPGILTTRPYRSDVRDGWN